MLHLAPTPLPDLLPALPQVRKRVAPLLSTPGVSPVLVDKLKRAISAAEVAKTEARAKVITDAVDRAVRLFADTGRFLAGVDAQEEEEARQAAAAQAVADEVLRQQRLRKRRWWRRWALQGDKAEAVQTPTFDAQDEDAANKPADQKRWWYRRRRFFFVGRRLE